MTRNKLPTQIEVFPALMCLHKDFTGMKLQEVEIHID